jgi:hypothetical protein
MAGVEGARLFTQELIDEIDDEKQFPSANYPELRNIRRCLRKLRTGEEAGMEWHEEPYGPWKRMRERYYKFRAGVEVRPSVPLDELDLEVKLTRKDLAKMKAEAEETVYEEIEEEETDE